MTSIVDEPRLQWVILRYDFWLDWSGVSWSRRRSLRRELRSNLREAAERVGQAQAIMNLGSVRELAAATAPSVTDRTRPRWASGLGAAVVAFVAVHVVFLLLAFAYLSAVDDAGMTEPVSGPIFPFPGSRVTAEASESAFGVEVVAGWLPLVVAAVTFVAVTKPWRIWRQRSPAGTTGGRADE
jgi:hypothetical protein